MNLPGVLYSEDGGENYEWLNSGMEHPANVEEFLVSPSGYIYIQCHGLLRSTEPVITGINQPYYSLTEQSVNIPNPFTDITTITWKPDTKDNNVSLKIWDIKGEVVLSTEINNNGKYIVYGSSLKPGVYLYILTGKNTFYSGKMVLVK